MTEMVSASVGTIVNIAFQIKEAVKTVRQNKEECCRIANCVNSGSGLLQHLVRETDISKVEVMRNTLEDVKTSFEEALKLVKKCQKKNILCSFFGAKDMAKDLSLLQSNIGLTMMQASLCSTVHGIVVATQIHHVVTPPPPRPLTMQEAFEGLTRFSLSVLKEATNDFSSENEIGQGGFSSVYRGMLHDGVEVAIKKFNSPLDVERKLFHGEFNIGAKLQHQNVVKLLGYCADVKVEMIQRDGIYVECEQRHYLLVMEYVPNGSLGQITEGTQHIGWSSYFKMIQEMAKGVCYLHEQRVIHLDLKPHNILFELDMNPVIIDFGLSKVLENGTDRIVVLDEVAGSVGYMAPEHYSNLVSTKSDVFSFGITLLQSTISVCTKSPTEPWQGREQWDKMLIDAGGLKGLLHQTVQVDEFQLAEINRCLEVGFRCIQLNEADRLTMPDVVDILRGEKALPAVRRNVLGNPYPRRGHIRQKILKDWTGESGVDILSGEKALPLDL